MRPTRLLLLITLALATPPACADRPGAPEAPPAAAAVESIEAPATAAVDAIEAPATAAVESIEAPATAAVEAIEAPATAAVEAIEAPATAAVEAIEAPATAAVEAIEAPATAALDAIEAPVAAAAEAVLPPVAAAPQSQDTESAVVEGQIAPRLQTLGSHTHPIQTKSPRAQLFFDQGLILTYGFNHREAGRAFQEVVRLDPDSPMGYWGQALALGPNINAPMNPDHEAPAHALIEEARARAGNGSERERAYVEALAARYTGAPDPDRAALDAAYAKAMQALHEADPADQDAAALYAESLMNLSPWDYWTRDGTPHERTKVILGVLEGIRAANPKHPGANHFYIHATEYARPDLGVPAADDLVDAVPGAGHLQHMPSHIYARVGRYADASAVNVKAIAADEDYITTCRAQGIYPLAYYPHNLHFFWWTTSLEGRSAESIATARQVVEKTAPFMDKLPEFAQVFPVTTLYALVRFGKWQEVLAEPEPEGGAIFPRAIRHYARGLAHARLGNLDAANVELAALAKLQRAPEAAGVIVGGNALGDVLALASAVLAGELAAEEDRYGDSLASLHRAVLLQDNLNYTEPPDWYYPVRQSLGAVLLEAGRAQEAEAVYWQDLRQHPESGWSLFGLAQALRAQGKDDQAAAIEARFQKVWSAADVKLEASRF